MEGADEASAAAADTSIENVRQVYQAWLIVQLSEEPSANFDYPQPVMRIAERVRLACQNCAYGKILCLHVRALLHVLLDRDTRLSISLHQLPGFDLKSMASGLLDA